MKKIPILLLLVLSLLCVTNCSKKVAVNNGNKYSLEPVAFKYEEDGNWGFIDFNGKIILEPMYENKPTSFKNGFAIISDDTVSYYINSKGDTIGSYYYSANSFNCERALVKNKAEELLFIDEKGNEVFLADTILNEQLRKCADFSCDLALFITRDYTYGYIDKSGHVIIDAKYTKANDFSEDLAYVEIKNEENKSTEKMLIDTKNKVVKKFDESLEWILDFNEGKAAFKDTSGCGYINTKGKIVIKPRKEWTDLTCFVNGYAGYKCGGDWGVIDSTGTKVLNSVYERPPFFYNGLAIIKENDTYGMINLKGNKIIEPVYENIAYPLFDEQFFAKDGKYYIQVDAKGKQISQEEYYRLDLLPAFRFSFKSGYILVGEKLGISSSQLQDISEETEDFIEELNDEFAKLFDN